MNRIVHFELAAEKPERAAGFYQKIFGWKFQKWSGQMEYWMVETGDKSEPGINGGFMKKDPKMPPTAHTIDVKSLDETVKHIEKNGGKVVMPKMAIPGIGWFARFKDTEGNEVGLMQADKNAK